MLGILGHFFDLDGDGKASLFEEYLGSELSDFFDVKSPDDEDDDRDWHADNQAL
ncbi:MAG: hypothetical protein IJT41_02640 [Clostridia bacterium]|nr:hypothetical protein [Clostridia bacterium]